MQMMSIDYTVMITWQLSVHNDKIQTKLHSLKTHNTLSSENLACSVSRKHTDATLWCCA